MAKTKYPFLARSIAVAFPIPLDAPDAVLLYSNVH
jgi:hypothetical protein